jgi:hypothetical protein
MALAKVSTTFANSAASAGAEQPSGDRRGYRLHCGREIGWFAHRRERQRHQALAMRRDQPVETQTQRGRVAAEGEFDGFAGQSLGFALQQHLGGEGGSVTRATRPTRGIAGTALLKWASPLFLLFLQEIISDH